MNPASYPGTGSALYNLVPNTPATATLLGNYAADPSGVRLFNTSGDRLQNVSMLQCPTLTNIRSISLWIKPITLQNEAAYLLDGRNGGANTWVYNIDGFGPFWTTATLYRGNSATALSPTWANLNLQANVWSYITIVGPSAFTDDITFFGRFSQNEGLNVVFGPILIWNRVISAQEHVANYDASWDFYPSTTEKSNMLIMSGYIMNVLGNGPRSNIRVW